MKTKSRLSILLCVSILLIFVTSSAFGATYSWKIPSNVRIVQKNDVDNVRTFTTIAGALNSITDASATNRYVVKVMPGIYNETVTMKAYVDIVGSGQNSTTISPATTGTGFITEDQTAVENLTITTSVLNNAYYSLVAIKGNTSAVFRNVTVKLPANANYEDIIKCSVDSQFQLINSKVLSDGTLSSIGLGIEAGGNSFDMVNSSITLSTNQSNVPVAIVAGPGMANITHSEIRIKGPNGADAINYWSGGTSTMKIFSSVISIEVVNDGDEDSAIYGSDLEIRNSQIIATSSNPVHTYGIRAFGNVKVLNSSVSGSSLGLSVMGSNLKIGNSQIIGGHDGTAGSLKVVNCFDGNYDPIPNL